MIIFAVNEPARLGDLKVVDQLTRVFPGDKGVIANDIITQFEKNPFTEKIIPINSYGMEYSHFFGICMINVYFMENHDMNFIMEKLNLKLIKGRMPVPGKDEILLDWKIANNKNKKLGDFIGKEVDVKEKMPGKYKIVGIINGDCIVGLSPVGDNQVSDLKYLMVTPKAHEIDKLNADFKNTPHEKAYFWKKDMSMDNYKKNSDTLNIIFGTMSIAIIFVMAFASGNSSYAQYFSRRHEFGILQSLGYTRGEILLRAAKEIVLLNLVGFMGGILLGITAGLVLNKVFFIPHGYPFRLMQPDGMIKAITIPICTALFGLIPAAWLLSKIDPMLVIEKFE